MIDTVKIYTNISSDIYNIIKNNSVVKTSYHNKTGEIFYNIINDHLQGSYDSSLSVRVDIGSKYKFTNGFVLELEENAYNIKLPSFKHWFVNRVDLAICFDLKEQNNVLKYISNLHMCDYPRRHLKNYGDYGGTGIYFAGTSTTLKIYNKYVEFKKHDLKKFKNTDFNIIQYLDTIKGFIRFEVEIKKKKLVSMYNNNYIRVRNIMYKDLKNIWSDEFMKLLKLYESDLKIVRSREEVESRLYTIYGNVKGRRLYNFYLSLIIDGLDIVKARTSKNVYYTNIRNLKNAGIDFSQKINIDFEDSIIDFNPFFYEEVV